MYSTSSITMPSSKSVTMLRFSKDATLTLQDKSLLVIMGNNMEFKVVSGGSFGWGWGAQGRLSSDNSRCSRSEASKLSESRATGIEGSILLLDLGGWWGFERFAFLRVSLEVTLMLFLLATLDLLLDRYCSFPTRYYKQRKKFAS